MQNPKVHQPVSQHARSIVAAILLLGVFSSVVTARVASIQIKSRN